MSWTPVWAPSGLSPLRPSTTTTTNNNHGNINNNNNSSTVFSDPSLAPQRRRDGSWTNAQTAELLKFSMSITGHHDRPHRQSLAGSTIQLPPIYGPIGFRRSPLPSFAALPPIIPGLVTGAQPPSTSSSSFPRKSSLADFQLPLSARHHHQLPSPIHSSYFCSPVPAPTKPSSSSSSSILIRPFDEPYSSPMLSPHPALVCASHPAAAYVSSNPPKRSKAALATEDWDHPSFARPPHRAVPEPSLLAKTADFWRPAAPGSPMDLSTDIHGSLSAKDLQAQPICDEPLVPNVYPVPPPPPYEQSAAPLSDLAADIVWERCYFPKPRAASTAPAAAAGVAPWDSAFSWSTSYGFHSSPTSHMAPSLVNPTCWPGGPSTTPGFGVIGAEAKARRFHRPYPPASSVSPPPPSDVSSHSPHPHGRKPSLGQAGKVEVKPAFRRWTRQVLESTLLSPQVLILALFYVDQLAGVDVFGDLNGKMSLAPYKMLLAALVVANKTLDDHSYRNSTFANVSSMTNAEVNAIEVCLLKALKFDVVPTTVQWTGWLKEVIGAGERSGLLMPPELVGPPSPISPHLPSPALFAGGFDGFPSLPNHLLHGSIFDQAPTPDFQWHPSSVDPRATSTTAGSGGAGGGNMSKPSAPIPLQNLPHDLRFLLHHPPVPVEPFRVDPHQHLELTGASRTGPNAFASAFQHHPGPGSAAGCFVRTYSGFGPI